MPQVTNGVLAQGMLRIKGRHGSAHWFSVQSKIQSTEGIYACKQRDACDFVPFHGRSCQCAVCGASSNGRDYFCSTECEQAFAYNHNWELAKPAAMHRDNYTCTRCGHQPDPSDPQARSSELVVRHIERPASPQYAQKLNIPTFANTRRNGCHQHLDNLITVCRFCDDLADSDTDPFSAPGDLIALDSPEDEAPAAPAPALAGPTTTISDHDLDPGVCRQREVDPDIFFEQRHRAQAVRLCAQCPVKLLCAQRALDLRDTDGIIAGVFLPGKRFPAKLEDRRGQLQQMLDKANGVDTAQTPAAPAPPVVHAIAATEACETYLELDLGLERASA